MSEIVLVIRDRECNQCCTVAVYGIVGGRFPVYHDVSGHIMCRTFSDGPQVVESFRHGANCICGQYLAKVFNGYPVTFLCT